jgi:iron complex outermembrane receptor protein
VLLLAGAHVPNPAAAQEGGEEADSVPPGFPDSVAAEVGGIEVEASRPTLTGGGATAVHTEMDSVEAVPSPTLAEVLRDVPLIRVRRNSRGQVQPSLRGMEERQIAVLVDEVPLTVGWDNRTDLSVIPMTAVNQIDMVRGLSSVLAGPNALGGIVKIGIGQGRFPGAIDEPVDLRTSVDQTGGTAVSGQVDHLVDAGDGRVWIKYGGGYRDRGDLAAPGDLAGPGVAGGRLVNTDMRFANGFVSARYQADGGAWASLSTAGYWTERGVLPELHLLGGDAPAPRFWRYPDQWQSLTSMSAGTGWRETPLGRGDLEASVGLDLRHQEIDGFGGLAFADSVEGETGDDRTVSLRLVGDHELGPGTLSAAFTWAETRHEEVLSSDPAPEEFVQRLWSLGLETTQPLAPDSDGWISEPRVTLGASYDASSTPGTGDAPPRPGIDGWGVRASAEATVAGGDGTLHGGVSRKVRFPALRELFSGALGKFEPNPGLGPLTLKVGELGATARPTVDLELQGTIFQQRLDGAIVRAVLPSGRFQRQNRGETRATGLELAANWRRGGLSVRGDLTLQSVELLDDAGDRVEGERAEYQPEVAGTLHARFPVALGLRARGGLEVIGTRFGADPRTGEFEEIGASAHVTVGLSRKLGPGFAGLPPLRASLVAENVTDAVVLDQLGLPRAGRTIRVQR